MTTAAKQPTGHPEAAVELWLRMYRKMLAIHVFEEQVSELYKRALMPGLAHLYSGEEAVAVGVCEPMRTKRAATSIPEVATPEITFAEAVREALAEEMRRDSRVYTLGEEVAEAGTPFKVLSRLVEEFGGGRVGCV
jgi:hypothetical protein